MRMGSERGQERISSVSNIVGVDHFEARTIRYMTYYAILLEWSAERSHKI